MDEISDYSFASISGLKNVEPKETSSLTKRYINFPPIYSKHGRYPKPKRYPIEQFSTLRDQESAIICDLLYVLAGFEGYYIRYATNFDPQDIEHQLEGPEFLINKRIDTSLKDITKRIVKAGKFYYALSSFVQVYNTLAHGRIMQAFCFLISHQLKEYENFLVRIEREYKTEPKFSLMTLEHKLNSSLDKGEITPFIKMQLLYSITIKINSENKKRSNNSKFESMHFLNIMKSLKDDHYTGTLDGVASDSGNSRFVKGGVILCLLQQNIDECKGNSKFYQYLRYVFGYVSKDYVEMLNNWLQFGIIDDPYNEFLIREATESDKKNFDAMQWADKFTIKREGLLRQFEETECQKKIILTGKYLSVFRECVGIECLKRDNNEQKLKNLQDPDVQIHIDDAYNRANNYIIQLFFGSYYLGDWINSLNNNFLLLNGASFDSFLDLSHNSLRRSFDRASLTSIEHAYRESYKISDSYKPNGCGPQLKVENTVRKLMVPIISDESFLNELSTILKTESTDANKVFSMETIDSLRQLLRSVLERNNTNLKSHLIAPKTKIDYYAIHRFTIDIGMPFPLNLILTSSQIFEYQLIFREQALMRFVDKSLSIAWKDLCHNKLFRQKQNDRSIPKWIQKFRMLGMDMTDFMRILQFYLNFTVIDVNWRKAEHTFIDAANNNNVSLETVYFELKTFLSTVLNNSMLTKLKLVKVLLAIFDVVLRFSSLTALFKQSIKSMAGHDNSFETENSDDMEESQATFGNIIKMLDNYSATFRAKLTEFEILLNYYGELDTDPFLQLYNSLSVSFQHIQKKVKL
ncbi:hypothetical protein HII13_000984 [Brettanomyces bruxellensis]|uniref:Spindle pole body component n=1 Tax=Dekkera bruxellensis TaxID=5007 RepID=A0A8H6BQJ8_DEKBR|nr:hypothetical protein HII13_000984 [Brettanomyces bruxellensis]KAF6015932.1 hypothetical protein HII12_000495 [Brettanomyces bruxellensis]